MSNTQSILENRGSWEIAPCPLCENNSSASEIAYRFILSNYLKCSHCGLIYLSPRLRADQMRLVYEDSSYFEGGNSSLGYQSYSSQDLCYAQTFRKRLLQILKHQLPGKSLDIGCGTGILIEEALKLGFDAHGIDVSSHGLQSRLKTLGHRFKQGTLSEVNYPEKSFNLITLFDVIEHIYSPKDFASELASIVADQGLVVMATPNYDSWLRKILGRHNVSFKIPEHVCYYTKETLDQVMSSHFESVECIPTGQICTLDFLRIRLERLSPLFKVFFSPLAYFVDLEKISFYVYSGSILSIYRKRA